jgi:O-antigen/teichoic acid export membrane protein
MTRQTANHNAHLTGGRLLARNTLWNLIGNGAPLVVAVFSIPALIRGLGRDRFGVLALAWALIGYASLFDLGLGRALTQLVAKKLGTGEDGEVPALVWTSLVLMLLLGIVGAAVVIFASPWLVHHLLNIPGSLQGETLQSFYLLGLSIPVVINTAGLRGLLEAYQRFGIINALRIPMGVFSYAGPLLALPFSKSLVPVVAVLAVGRLVGWAAHLLVCLRILPELRQGIVWQSSAIGSLLRFGGWMTVSNVIGPLMLTIDRFFIGALLSVQAVAYYATPYEMVTKLLVLSGALAGVMFPAFSTTTAQDPQRAARLYDRSILAISGVLTPICLLIVVFARPILALWIGPQFAESSFKVAQILSIGVLLLGLESLPFALLQAIGRPDLPAKTNLIEVPLYVGAFWFLTVRYGLVGAATAWSLRASLDGLVLILLAHRFLPRSPKRSRFVLACLVMSIGMVGAILIPAMSVQVGSLSLSLMVSVLLCSSMVHPKPVQVSEPVAKTRIIRVER